MTFSRDIQIILSLIYLSANARDPGLSVLSLPIAFVTKVVGNADRGQYALERRFAIILLPEKEEDHL